VQPESLSHQTSISETEIRKPEENPVKKIIQTENAPKPAGPYAQAVKAGKFLFVSGQLAIDQKKGRIVANDIKGQTTRVMENIKAILQAASYSLGDVAQSNVYLSSMALFSEFNSVYAEYFGKEFPSRVTVGIELMPSALVEISVVAYKE
jgi:2-iminobutanoate/2-iminopropanoate deaminase